MASAGGDDAADGPPRPHSGSTVVAIVLGALLLIGGLLALNQSRDMSDRLSYAYEGMADAQATTEAVVISLKQTQDELVSSRAAEQAAVAERDSLQAELASAESREISARAEADTATASLGGSTDALDIALRMASKVGPLGGELPHRDDNFISTKDAGISLKNFILEVQFANPYSTTRGSWDYGVGFRSTGANAQYRLIVSSNGTWNFSLSTSQDGKDESLFIADGAVENLDASEGGKNTFRLFVQDDRALLFVNGAYTASLDVSTKQTPGDLWLGTGMLGGNEIDGAATTYSGLRVWVLR
jgi:hypothetical protein